MQNISAFWREITLLESIQGVLGWDEQVMLPQKGAAWRGSQSALLARLVHDRLTDQTIWNALQNVDSCELPATKSASLLEIKRRVGRARRIPGLLVEELAKATSHGVHVWQEARGKNDFEQFLPALDAIIRLKREEAACVGFEQSPYDALLDEYEPGCRSSEIDGIFNQLEPALSALIAEAQTRPQAEILAGDYPKKAQKTLGMMVAKAIGFDEKAGRLDTSAHPFCSGHGPGDCRITTRYDETDFTQSFYGILHETGHALYEQGLPTEHAGEAWCVATSLGMHESQSRFWENMVGRSAAFWEWCWPMARQVFGNSLPDRESLVRRINRIGPSLIRVEADETCYNLHILLRYRLEKAMIEGSLEPKDLPDAWNEAFKKAFGISVPSDQKGCLQDVHWGTGGIGYFPTYTLGNLIAAQLWEAMDRGMGGIGKGISKGEFTPILAWLRDKIHRRGRLNTALEITKQATGEALSCGALLRHLAKIGGGEF